MVTCKQFKTNHNVDFERSF